MARRSIVHVLVLDLGRKQHRRGPSRRGDTAADRA
jgi:hypothetical protein